MDALYYTRMDSPVGDLILGGDATALRYVGFQAGPRAMAPAPEWEPAEAPFREAVRQLRAYFAGRLRTFDLPLAPRGTPFQLAVWQALRGIAYGDTCSYGELAARIGRPTASRAVGAANGRNPLPIIVPCHRVVGSDGALTGFGGGLPIKQALLELEQRHAGRGPRQTALL